jgi:hypothetical protein
MILPPLVLTKLYLYEHWAKGYRRALILSWDEENRTKNFFHQRKKKAYLIKLFTAVIYCLVVIRQSVSHC